MAEEQYEEDMQKEKVIKQLVLCFFSLNHLLIFFFTSFIFFQGKHPSCLEDK